MCVRCSHSAKSHSFELMCSEWQSNLPVCSCLRAVATCSCRCVYNRRPVSSACHLIVHVLPPLWLAGSPARECDCVIVRWLSGLGYIHSECLSIGWKPAKQAALEQACFVSLSTWWSHSRLMWERTTRSASWGASKLDPYTAENEVTSKPISLISQVLPEAATKEEAGNGSSVCYSCVV